MRALDRPFPQSLAWAGAGALVAAALSTACKGRPSYDQSTPEAAIASLFRALDTERLPRDLDRFFADPDELDRWRVLCETRGCAAGSYEVVARDVHAARATLHLDFEVTGDRQARVMHGVRTRFALTREGERWMVRQVGEPLRGRPKMPQPAPAAPPDGSPPER